MGGNNETSFMDALSILEEELQITEIDRVEPNKQNLECYDWLRFREKKGITAQVLKGVNY